jgi:argininosuccinate lyase
VLREKFSRPLDPAAAAFSASTVEDAALLPHDLWGSLAHARMLGATGILPRRSARRIERGLRSIATRAARGRFPLDPAREDVHLNVETALTRALGADGERLHTGRSRNDQVATDLALYLRDSLLALELRTLNVVDALLAAARGPDGRRTVPGWTHLQPAQQVYWAQILATHALRLLRDVDRCAATRARGATSPLGAGAIAGSSLALDRRRTARLLGFAGPGLSSIDDVSDRDTLLAATFDQALLATHLASLGDELVLGAMPEVGRVRLADEYSTTSSLMPHKRNPDLAELARAEAGPALGRLVAQLAIVKGLPHGYHRDLQATKGPYFEGTERLLLLLTVVAGMVRSARFLAVAPPADSGMGSVEIADALVRAGVPFRSAHARVAVWLARPPHGTGRDRTSEEFLRAFPELRGRHSGAARPDDPDVRTSHGGSAWVEVRRSLDQAALAAGRARRSARREVARLDRLRRRLGAYPPAFLVAAATTSRREPTRARARSSG